MKLPLRPVLAVSAVACICTLVYLSAVPRVSADALRFQVARELPAGTSRAAVEDWLTRQGLKFDRLSEVGDDRPVGIECIIEGVYRVSLLGRTDIDLYFYFDADDRLLSVNIEESTNSL